jgi:ABC-type uncharacterized transport system substrate-binding protein
MPQHISRLGLFERRILKGAKPADLPVEQAARFEMVVNQKSCFGRLRLAHHQRYHEAHAEMLDDD